MKSSTKTAHLSDFIRLLEARGQCVFTKQEAISALSISENAFLQSIRRLAHKGYVAYIKKSLYMIISNDYFHRKTLSPDLYIDQLMAHLKCDYYVGLLSAASFYGATHQAVLSFQVIVNKKMRRLLSRRLNVKFYYSKNFNLTPTQKLKTPAGYMKVSTPEGTAFDLIRYFHQSGHLNHVATVLSELGEALNGHKLAVLAKNFSIFHAQRLGYLLDFVGYTELTKKLHSYIQSCPLKYVPIRPDAPCQNVEKNTKWYILINEPIDPDEI